MLYEGTVDVALRQLSNLSDYEKRKAQFLSGVKFSVEQVLYNYCYIAISIAHDNTNDNYNSLCFRVSISPVPPVSTGQGSHGLP